MHIKTLRIQGFKTYRDQTAVEEFSPGHNVVVGRNGSGKSNFFAAIRFVLSDAYNTMTREQRQDLLHKSSTSSETTLSAFVEIVFDNSDGRFPHGSNSELTLRRTIGVKKDEYYLDRKSVTKQEVLNMLEAAGFSRSNPYYIVPQGRITDLTIMKDADRLNLLKDVAGTKVYETRRADSLRIMEETNVKKEKIEELLTHIDERLKELDNDRKELKEYHAKDKERKILEYGMYYQEQVDAVGKLEDLAEKKLHANERNAALTTQFNEGDVELERLEEQLRALNEESKNQRAEMESLISECRDLAMLRANLESSISDQEERSERSGNSRDELEARAAEVDTRINEVEAELMSLIPALEDKRGDLAQARAALDDVKAKVDILLAKQARSERFQTKAQRDAALREEITSLQSFASDQEKARTEAQQEVQTITTKLGQLEEALTRKSAQLEERHAFVLQRARKWDDLKAQEDVLVEKRKALWKEQQIVQNASATTEISLNSNRKLLYNMMDRATRTGLEAVEEIAQRLNLRGVHGPVYKLFKTETAYRRCVDITAGQSLFHVVVDTDDTAAKVLEVMNREKSGRVTFIPLNRIKPKPVQFSPKSDAVPMLTKMVYDSKYKLAMQQIFARTIVCPSLDVASSYVREHDINAITLDGDRVERKGALTGGSVESRTKDRLTLAGEVSNLEEEYKSQMRQLRDIRQSIVDLDQGITSLTSQRETMDSRARHIMASRQTLLDEMQALREEEAMLQNRMQKLTLQIEQYNRDIESSNIKRNAMEAEMTTPLQRGLRSAEEAELKALTARLTVQEKEVTDLNRAVNEMTNQKQMHTIDLEVKLKRERERIAGQLENLEEGVGFSQENADVGATTAQTILARRKQLRNVKKQSEERQKQLDRGVKVSEDLQKQIQTIQEEVDQAISAQAKVARDIQKHEKGMAVHMAKVKEQTTKREEAERKIRELGIVPGETYNKYISTSSETILKLLHKANNALKKFSNVNRRAVEQYDSFTKQRDELLSRQEDLDRSAESIQELIDTLDMRKDEAIETTFKQVSKNFGEVFEKLVPLGKGQLIMQRRVDEDNDAMEVDGGSDTEEEGDRESRSKGSSIENYIGVSIKVSFHSKVDEGLRIQQLSGGQKSLVALAIVFAIQKCDPAAFYLFDEIDANLDAQYRTAVAAMIQEMSSNAQFITTTFRPELVGVGEKHYGVLLNEQRVSSLQPITQDDAYNFVEASQQAA